MRMSSDKSEDKSQNSPKKKTGDETLFSFATRVLNRWDWDGKHRSKPDAQTGFTLWITLLTSELQPYFLELVSRYHKALIYDFFYVLLTHAAFKLVFRTLSQESLRAFSLLTWIFCYSDRNLTTIFWIFNMTYKSTWNCVHSSFKVRWVPSLGFCASAHKFSCCFLLEQNPRLIHL
jgi:hypothetical protein